MLSRWNAPCESPWLGFVPGVLLWHHPTGAPGAAGCCSRFAPWAGVGWVILSHVLWLFLMVEKANIISVLLPKSYCEVQLGNRAASRKAGSPLNSLGMGNTSVVVEEKGGNVWSRQCVLWGADGALTSGREKLCWGKKERKKKIPWFVKLISYTSCSACGFCAYSIGLGQTWKHWTKAGNYFQTFLSTGVSTCM